MPGNEGPVSAAAGEGQCRENQHQYGAAENSVRTQRHPLRKQREPVDSNTASGNINTAAIAAGAGSGMAQQSSADRAPLRFTCGSR
jgi:hypothetical protein